MTKRKSFRTPAHANVKEREDKTKHDEERLMRESNTNAMNKTHGIPSSPDLKEHYVNEMRRRTNEMRSQLYGLLLSSREEQISTNQIVSLLILLVQESLFVFLYEKVEEKGADNKSKATMKRVDYFDVEKAIYARGSETEFESFSGFTQGANNVIARPQETLPIALAEKHLFPVFALPATDQKSKSGTSARFYLRLFRLTANPQSDPNPKAYSRFIEVVNSEPEHKRIYNRDILKWDRVTSADYIAECTRRLFEFTPYENMLRKASNDSLIYTSIRNICDATFHAQRWTKQRKRRDPASPDSTIIHSITEVLEVKKSTEEFFQLLGANRGHLDRLYRRVSRPARFVKEFSNTCPPREDHVLPNIFFAFRSYDRQIPRYIVGKETNVQRGFAHNIRFVIPHHQREDIIQYFEQSDKAVELATTSYALPPAHANDFFSDLDRETGVHQDEKDFRLLRKELDNWFMDDILKKRDFAELWRVLESPVGRSAISFLEPTFYAGTVVYRYPFRLRGGLSRIETIVQSLKRHQANTKQPFGLADIRPCFSRDEEEGEAEVAEAITDAKRIVAMYYIMRAFAPAVVRRKDYWTTLVLMPVEVYGSIPTIVGFVQYQAKEVLAVEKKAFAPRTPQQFDPVTWAERLSPTATAQWNLGYHFHKDIFLVVARDIRRMYRDMQFEFVEGALEGLFTHKALVSTYSTAKALTDLPALLQQNWQTSIAKQRRWKRTIPLPEINIRFGKSENSAQNPAVERLVGLEKVTNIRWLAVFVTRLANNVWRHEFGGISLRGKSSDDLARSDREPTVRQELSDLELTEYRLRGVIAACIIRFSRDVRAEELLKSTQNESKTQCKH